MRSCSQRLKMAGCVGHRSQLFGVRMLYTHNLKEKCNEKGLPMDIRILTYFLTTSREENITKAAQLLHITQPTLSRQLMQLEELGVKLFQRSNHCVYLTSEGMVFRRRALELVNLDGTVQLNTSVHHELAGWSGDFAKQMELRVNYNLL